MTLTESRLRAALGARQFRFYPQVGSTNDIARAWLAEGAAHGALVIADEQVSGRGRLGRGWSTPPGTALAVSVVLRVGAGGLPQVTLLGALAIAETLDELGAPDVAIKWPNDVLLSGRKVSGVLTEADWDGNRLRGAVLGMGVNVRVDFTGTPLEQTAISIEPALGRPVDRSALLAALIERVMTRADLLGSDALLRAWRARLVTLGQAITLHLPGGTLSGIAEDVTAEGALLVRTAAGQSQVVHAGDVSASAPPPTNPTR